MRDELKKKKKKVANETVWRKKIFQLGIMTDELKKKKKKGRPVRYCVTEKKFELTKKKKNERPRDIDIIIIIIKKKKTGASEKHTQ